MMAVSKEGLNEFEPGTWHAPIVPEGNPGIAVAAAVSQAISAKRQADALERIAGALTSSDSGATVYNMVTNMAWDAGKAFESGRGAA